MGLSKGISISLSQDKVAVGRSYKNTKISKEMPYDSEIQGERYREIDVLIARKEILKQFLLLLLGECASFTGIKRHWIRDILEKQVK